LLLFAVSFLAPGWLAHAQADKPADNGARSASAGATKEEVEQLRREVADLKATIQQLVEANRQGAERGARLVPAVALHVQPGTAAEPAEAASLGQQAAPKKGGEVALQAGWNGEHFFVKSSDGNFAIQPYGYTQLDYRAYGDDPGTPPNTFAIRRGRFGFQGTLYKHYEFGLLADFADTSSTLVRDFYVNINYRPELQFQFGQFKEPFAQELMTAATYLDFVERSLAVNLYPSQTSFRSPGAMVHGDLYKGVVQYWAGAFNGKGTLGNNTTSEPEVIGRLRFYPWKNCSNEWLKGFAFGGAAGHGVTRRESSFSGLLPDRAFTFFRTTTVNGPVERYNGELTWTKGPWGVRAEYDQLNQFREALGAGLTDLPGVVGKGYYAQATYLLTGEKRPENGQPKPNHPFLATEGARGFGAWELKLRYANLQAAAAGTLENRVDQFSQGINWYPNYFIRYMVDFNVERLKNPTVGLPIVLQPQTFLAVLQRVQVRF
jgi:phosphate-selective porin OprO/OprP